MDSPLSQPEESPKLDDADAADESTQELFIESVDGNIQEPIPVSKAEGHEVNLCTKPSKLDLTTVVNEGEKCEKGEEEKRVNASEVHRGQCLNIVEDKWLEEPKEVFENPTNVVSNKTPSQNISIRVHQAGDSKSIRVLTNTINPVFELRFKIFEATRILPSNQVLKFENRVLPLQKQLGECMIFDGARLDLTDEGEAITEYLIEITDAKNVRKLKTELRALEDELLQAKKRSTDKLKENDWERTFRLVQDAQALELRKAKKVEELTKIHRKHKKGFRQLHSKIRRLFSEKAKTSADYKELKQSLMASVQRNEILRSKIIVADLMEQFVRHDGCKRELMLLEAFVPDMVQKAAAEADPNKDGFSEGKNTRIRSPCGEGGACGQAPIEPGTPWRQHYERQSYEAAGQYVSR